MTPSRKRRPLAISSPRVVGGHASACDRPVSCDTSRCQRYRNLDPVPSRSCMRVCVFLLLFRNIFMWSLIAFVVSFLLQFLLVWAIPSIPSLPPRWRHQRSDRFHHCHTIVTNDPLSAQAFGSQGPAHSVAGTSQPGHPRGRDEGLPAFAAPGASSPSAP